MQIPHAASDPKRELMKIRKATKNDIPAIIALLADDELGIKRENNTNPLPQSYYEAFHVINEDPNQELLVVENEQGQVIGTMQLSFIRYLTYQGGTRAQIEAVRIHKSRRGTGLGTKMFEWAISKAKEKEAHVLQLTTDKQRPEALKFYENLGFKATHHGMKLHFK